MQKGDGYYTCRFDKVRFPLGVTLLTESPEQKVRHPAVVVALCETGGEFASHRRVVPGQAIGFILHPDVRYAVRGRVIWTRPAQDGTQFEFGVAFEENIPASLWETFAAQVRAA